MKLLSVTCIFMCVFLLVFFSYKVSRLEEEVKGLKKATVETIHHKEKGDEFELAEKMNTLQRYTNKLYFSGKEKNKPLVKFYLHELEETMAGIIEAEVFEDGVNISENMELYGEKTIERLEKAFENTLEEFDDEYINLINACNACHMVSNHPFVKITEPKTPIFDNQDYGRQ